MAWLASERSTCPRASVGCVIVSNKHAIATGYNGSVAGKPHCTDEGCIVVDGHCVRTVHAEINALAQAAMSGASTEGAIAYVTHTPCISCGKALAAAGITEVHISQRYRQQRELEQEIHGLEFYYE